MFCLSEFLQVHVCGSNTETLQQNLEIPEIMPNKDDGRAKCLSRVRKTRCNEVF